MLKFAKSFCKVVIAIIPVASVVTFILIFILDNFFIPLGILLGLAALVFPMMLQYRIITNALWVEESKAFLAPYIEEMAKKLQDEERMRLEKEKEERAARIAASYKNLCE